ncbi:MAG: glycosyltransferase family 8 protein [Hyphomicrobiaceae bacterium]
MTIHEKAPINERRVVASASAPPEEEVVVSFGIDSSFVPHVATVIASIVAHAPDARLRFLVLHSDIEPSRRAMLESVAPLARFDWIEIKDSDVPRFRDRYHFTRAILFRLGLEKLAPLDCGRTIYLDADVIVLRDIRELWRTDLGGNPIGGVPDTFAYYQEYLQDFPRQWGLELHKGDYVNSGVLLIDLDEVRRERSFSKVIEFIAEHGDTLLFADQDAINVVYWGRCALLANEWNTLRDRAIPNVAASLPLSRQLNGRTPAIVHFNHKFKPWLRDGYRDDGYHPWSWLYWRYLARTPFMGEVIETHGVGTLSRTRAWLRWLKRRPPGIR